MSFEGRRVEVNGIGLHVAEAGPPAGEPVLLLHGFPDSSSLWRHQLPALAAAGFRVVAPDVRGFGLSDRPAEVDAYAIPTLLGDAVGLLDALGIARAHVVCHDWGAALGWGLAMFLPDRVARFAALSVGHFGSFFDAGLEQREKSWYMLYFQYEGIAEEALRADDWKLFRDWARHWYRANVNPARPGLAGMEFPPVKAPTLGIWSSGDAYLVEAQMKSSERFVAGEWRYERFDGASHWLMLDQPERLSRLLVDWLKRT